VDLVNYNYNFFLLQILNIVSFLLYRIKVQVLNLMKENFLSVRKYIIYIQIHTNIYIKFIVFNILIIISLFSCNVGDYVLVVWDSIYRNYIVYQENKRNLVFLHPDSIDNLFLKLGSGKYFTFMLNMLYLFIQN